MNKIIKYILVILTLVVMIPLALMVGNYLGYKIGYEWVQSDSVIWNNHHIKLNEQGFTARTLDSGNLVILGLKENFFLTAKQLKSSPALFLKLHADQVCKKSECLFKKQGTAEFSSKNIPYLYYSTKEPIDFEAYYAIESQNVLVTISSEISLDNFDSIINSVISGVLNNPKE